MVPWTQAEATHDPLRCLENIWMCGHDYTKVQVFVVLKHIFMVEKRYVTFVVFVKEKRKEGL